MIGAGNLACHLTKALVDSGFRLIQVFSSSYESAFSLADLYAVSHTTTPDSVSRDADLYFICLKDNAVHPFLERAKLKNKFLIHCSGGLSLELLTAFTENAGVLYPLQTFTKSRPVNFREVPVFLEYSTGHVKETMMEIAGRLSDNVFFANGNQRAILHIAAVFSGNFVNHLYSIADSLLEENQMDFQYLWPLMKETLSKALTVKPLAAQTGPAVRNDQEVIAKHLTALKGHSDLQSIYSLISEHIHKSHQK